MVDLRMKSVPRGTGLVLRPQSRLLGILVAAVTAASCSGSHAASAPSTTAAASVATTVPSTTAVSSTTSTSEPATSLAPTTSDAGPDRRGNDACLARAVFGDPADSPYLLPFPAGEGYTVFQSYCHLESSHETQLAYDFWMPIGSQVTAARSGVVRDLREDVSDEAQTSLLNFVFIEHADGTAAFYAHLTQDGALVEMGQEVEAGELIALSGASGRTHYHGVLHFQVFRTWPPREEGDVAVNFSNTEGLPDDRGGLKEGAFYRAMP